MIMYGKDHYDRGKALADALGEKAGGNMLADPRFIPKTDDWTLTVWGHGGPEVFCEMTNLEFCIGLKAWKERNAALRTVEIITCDARHNAYDYLSSYAKSVASYLKSKGIPVTVKALPAGQAPTDQSILWASANTRSFCYITSQDPDGYTWANERLLQVLPGLQDDCNQAAQQLAKERLTRRFTVNGGYLGSSLRGMLSVVDGGD